MNARQVHAILAAGAQNPNLIAKWKANPQFFVDRGIPPNSVDLDTLWKFAGLAVKVRHNGLRQQFPLTFRLMRLVGLEIDVFASYATYCASQGQQLGATSDERANDLRAFLEQWLDLGKTTHALIWDMIRHEQAIASLTRLILSPAPPITSVPPSHSLKRPSGSSVPRVCGEIILYEMQSDPRTIESLVYQHPPLLDQIPFDTRYFCYWFSEQVEEISILELDAFGYYALSFVDGDRSISELSRQLGCSNRPTRSFLRSMKQLGITGILKFEPITSLNVL